MVSILCPTLTTFFSFCKGYDEVGDNLHTFEGEVDDVDKNEDDEG